MDKYVFKINIIYYYFISYFKPYFHILLLTTASIPIIIIW